MDEMNWDKRPPARQTLDMLRDKDKEICALKEKDNQFALITQGMGDKMDAIKVSLDEHKEQQKEDFNELKTSIDSFIKSADGKYANKFTEVLLWRIVFGVGVFAILTVVYFIFDKVGLRNN
jgi:hypothetical protein